ncbi:hybrid sensor histidine kinase/response regulator [Polaromonas sp. LjRoot131]|uniref:hybrid sensor histidine kinase/response regulator n=1 Tax=Polaromonas sp. LjRoot131 TaxID=3342262 RepID=UPI003ECEA3AC
MGWLKRLFGHYEAYHAHGRPLLKYIGIVGALTYVVFYLIRFTKPNPRPYDDLGMRVLVVILFTVLAMKNHWPQKLKKYYFSYSYWALIYCLPFFNVFLSLKRHGGIPAISNCFIALSFLVMIADWRNTIAMLLIGCGSAALLYVAITPHPAIPMDMVAQLPAYLLILIGGAAFKLSERQIDAEKLRLANALAGSIAHEMRNPLGQAKMSLESIGEMLPANGNAIPAEDISRMRQFVNIGEIAVHRGHQVIDLILGSLKSSTVDRSKFAYLSAAKATQKAVDEYSFVERDVRDDRGNLRDRVTVRVVKDFAFYGDETPYVFVLFNLIKNALYYLGQKADATIVLTVDDHKVIVRDTGPGIDREVLAHLFESFMTSGKAEGTGLGLSYCKRTMQSFGGDIHCDSVVGEFTQFTLTFPLLPQTEIGEVATPLQTPMLPARPVISSDILEGRTVILAEDDELNRLMVGDCLKSWGLNVLEAEGGRQVLAHLNNTPSVDLILMDMNMPGLNGVQTTQAIRSRDWEHRGIFILALSGNSEELDVRTALKAGMNGYILKNGDMKLLQGKMLEALAGTE